jgi:hypothetical protein
MLFLTMLSKQHHSRGDNDKVGSWEIEQAPVCAEGWAK